MALVPTVLQSGFAALFKGQHPFPDGARFPKTKEEAAGAWAEIYGNYAQAGQSCKGVPATASPGLPAAKVTLQNALVGAFSGVDPATTSAAIASAVTAFWLTPPLAFPPDGLVSVVGGTAVLQSGLIAQWASNMGIPPPGVTADAAAAQMATLFDTFTRTVAVAHTAPPPCALPLV